MPNKGKQKILFELYGKIKNLIEEIKKNELIKIKLNKNLKKFLE